MNRERENPLILFLKTSDIIIRNWNKNHLNHVLLVFPSAFSANCKNMLLSSIIKKLELEHMTITKTLCEESCFVFKVNDIVEAEVVQKNYLE